LKALSEWDVPVMNVYRIMVFLPSNAFIDYFAMCFAHYMPDVKTLVLHGGLAQNKRSQVSETFATTDNCILFTSDASGRGLDYKDVSCVIQLGFDARPEYLQRVGRTGRAGRDGITYVITAPQENVGLQMVCDVLSEIYIDTPASMPMCSQVKSLKTLKNKYVASEYQYPKPQSPKDAKDAKKALGGWLGALASKWKRMKMPSVAVLELARTLADALHIPMEDSKLMEKLNIKPSKPSEPSKPVKPIQPIQPIKPIKPSKSSKSSKPSKSTKPSK
jgi:superfamily II DNA/RNA helicase